MSEELVVRRHHGLTGLYLRTSDMAETNYALLVRIDPAFARHLVDHGFLVRADAQLAASHRPGIIVSSSRPEWPEATDRVEVRRVLRDPATTVGSKQLPFPIDFLPDGVVQAPVPSMFMD